MAGDEGVDRRSLLKGSFAAVGLGASIKAHARPASSDEAAVAAEAVLDAFNRWLAQATYEGGDVRGVIVRGGSLDSPVDIAEEVEQDLLAQRLDRDLARAVALTAHEAWTSWARGWSLPPSRAFPEFAAVASPEAPTRPSKPVKLAPRASRGFQLLGAARLEQELCDKLRSCQPGDARSDLVRKIARLVGQQVAEWSAVAMVEGILAGGSVPTFAPPYVPVGPVVGRTEAGPVIVTRL